MKLKSLIYEIDNSIKLEDFLKKFKKENPNATYDEISNAIISFLHKDNISNKKLYEFNAGMLIKFILPVLISVYGNNNAENIIKHLSSKLPNDKSVFVEPEEKTNVEKVIDAVEKYSKKYNIDKKYIYRILKKETSFDTKLKKYNPHQIGDKNNVLGPSYGPCQIKVSTAKEICKKYPEPDLSPSDVTADKLLNDIDFNIRMCCKILSSYYHHTFGKIKNTDEKIAYAASMYNLGKRGFEKYGINNYGKFISGVD